MSILIKMEMPKNCEECNLESFCNLWVDAKRMCGENFTDSKARVKATIRHPNCPLVELPPHGDLIDGDALIEEWDNGLMDDAPTIIEAESEDE